MSSNHAGASTYIDWKMLYETDPPGVLNNKVQQEQLTRLMQEKSRLNLVLDLGCGLGSFWSFLSGMHVIGMDVNLSPTAIRRAKQYGVDLILGDAHHLPFKEGSFDLILERHILEHLEKPTLVLRENSRILRDSGAFLVSVPCFFDKIVLPGLTPMIMVIRKMLQLLLGNTEKQNPRMLRQEKENLETGIRIFKMLQRCKPKYLSSILIRMFWLFIRTEICITEHRNRYGWSWVSLIRNMGFIIDDVKGCGIFYPITIFLQNNELLNQLERRVRSKFPFVYMGESICISAHRK